MNAMLESDLLADYQALHSDQDAETNFIPTERIDQIELCPSIEFASFTYKLTELLDLAPGVVVRGPSPIAPLSLKLQGEKIADLELCLIGGEFAFRVIAVSDPATASSNNQADLRD